MHKSSRSEKEDREKDYNSKPSNVASSDSKGDLKDYIKDQSMIKVLNKKGISRLFPIQYETFKLIQKGEDVVAKDRTGSGKTLAFALPIIMRMRNELKFKGSHNPKFLIVLPTRQLAIQVKEQIFSLRHKDQEDFVVTAIYGGSGIQEQLDAVSKGIDIIVGTPGRLIDFLNRGAIKLNQLQAICLDEADEMLKIGFKDDIQKIFQFITKATITKVQCLLFSATIPEWIWEISDKYQSKGKKFIDMIKDSNVKTSKTVEHYCIKSSPMQKQAYIGSIIKYFLKGKSGKVIIFCQTKRQVDRIGNSGLIPFSVQILHGDIKQFQREKVFRKFKNGQVQCLVATNVAARGLDFPEIDLIIQMQPPNTTDAYIHRSGRTGRAGRAGICVTLYSSKEENLMRRIQQETKIILHRINTRQLTPATSNDKYRKEQSNYQERSHRQKDYSRQRPRNQEGRNSEWKDEQRKYDRYEKKQSKQSYRQRDVKTSKNASDDIDY